MVYPHLSIYRWELIIPWSQVVAEIRSGNEGESDALYVAVSGCARAQLVSRVEPQSVDDYVQEVVIIVLQAIRGGELRDPACLMGFVRTVTRRQVALHIRDAVNRREKLVSVEVSITPLKSTYASPESLLVWQEKVAALRAILERLCDRDREILVRFYYEEQDSQHICREMQLTATQFRLYKSRALAKCEDLSHRKQSHRIHRLVHQSVH